MRVVDEVRPPGRHRARRRRRAPTRRRSSSTGDTCILRHRRAARRACASCSRSGMFDGVHRGHRRVIDALDEAHASSTRQPVVLTFDPHPAAVLRGAQPPRCCAISASGLSRLRSAGVTTIGRAALRRDVRRRSRPRAFLDAPAPGRQLAALVMTAGIGLRARIVTARSTPSASLAPELGFEVVEVRQAGSAAGGAGRAGGSARRSRPVGWPRPGGCSAGRMPSSARSSTATAAAASSAFRRPTSISHAPVVLPPNGIYAVRVSWGGRRSPVRRAPTLRRSVSRPTFGTGSGCSRSTCSIFDGDLYGQRLRVEFVRRQRGERKFGSVGGPRQADGPRRERARTTLPTEPRNRRTALTC